MAYILSDIATRGMRRAGNTGFSSTEAKAFANDVQNEINGQFLLPFWEATPQTYTLTINNQDITSGAGLPSNYVLPISVTITTTDKEVVLDPVEKLYTNGGLEEFLESHPVPTTTAAAKPYMWYYMGGEIRVFPKPDVAYVVSLRYQRAATQISGDDDVPEIPFTHEEIFVYGIAARICEQEDLDDKSAVLLKKSQDKTSEMVYRYSKGYKHKVHTVRLANHASVG